MKYVAVGFIAALLLIFAPVYAVAVVPTNEDVKTENNISGLGCILKVDRNTIILGDSVTLLIGAKTSRNQNLYLLFTPSDRPDALSDENLPQVRQIRLSPGKTEWIEVAFSPKKAGRYTFCAQLWSASPTAAVAPFRAISNAITITAKEKPQQGGPAYPPQSVGSADP